jgi:Zn-dependent protease with chaperone function
VGESLIERGFERANAVASFGSGLIGIGTSIAGAVMAAGAESLLEEFCRWRPTKELTCDRAALLVCRDVDVASRALAKLMLQSTTLSAHLNVGALLRQYDDAQVHELLAAVDPEQELEQTHPYMCYRIRMLQAWSLTTHYKALAALVDAQQAT